MRSLPKRSGTEVSDSLSRRPYPLLAALGYWYFFQKDPFSKLLGHRSDIRSSLNYAAI